MSKLLTTLQQQALAESDPYLRSVLDAKIAAYLARIGMFDEAKRIVAQLRREHGDGSSPLISAWIMLCEGLLAAFSQVSPQSRDRVARSLLISRAIGNRELAALSSAWKAHLDFEFSDYSAMFHSLRSAMENLDDGDFSALARLSLVVANVHYVCGDRAGAQRWFLKSRDAAVAIGDQATIDAALYNRAAFSFGWLRSEACFKEQPQDLIKIVRSEIESAMTFQHITQAQALINIIHLSHARMLMLEGRFEPALEKLLRCASDGPFGSHNFSKSAISVELALCRKKLEQLSHDELASVPAHLQSLDGLDTDEMMATVWTGIQVLDQTPLSSAIPDLQQRLAKLQDVYRHDQARLIESLRDFELSLS